MKVYVKSKLGKWLMPTHPAKARVLLKEGRAKVIQRTPFAIQLTYETTEYTQYTIVGIDDGGIIVGIAVISGNEILYQEEVELRDGISGGTLQNPKTSGLMYFRSNARRGRRSRKRYRQSRNDNRGNSRGVCKVCGGNTKTGHILCSTCLKEADGTHQAYRNIKQTEFRLPPSIKTKKNEIMQRVKRIPLPIDEIRLEDAYFDFRAMKNPNISGEEYQKGSQLYHKNYKVACFTRDDHKCYLCESTDDLHPHHIQLRRHNGSDRLSNLITLCKSCHDKMPFHEKASISWKDYQENYKPDFYEYTNDQGSFRSASHVQQGKNYLQYELSQIAPVKKTFGYITSYYRNKANIKKSHINDAVIIANKDAIPKRRYIKTKYLRARHRRLHKQVPRKLRSGEPNTDQYRKSDYTFEVKGFRKLDTVRCSDGQIGYISGFSGSSAYVKDKNHENIIIRSLKSKSISMGRLELIHHNQSRVSFLSKQGQIKQEDDLGMEDNKLNQKEENSKQQKLFAK